jgi:hypothetical protein
MSPMLPIHNHERLELPFRIQLSALLAQDNALHIAL